MRVAWLVALVVGTRAFGAECASCHAKEAAAHKTTRMAHAMVPVSGSAFAENIGQRALSEPGDGYQFTYVRDGGRLVVTAAQGLDAATGVIEWVMGAGAQGQTPIVRDGALIRESRVSYFPQLHEYGITIGQNSGASRNAEDALGLKQSAKDAASCLACHATRVGANFEVETPGVQCERCHPGAEQHSSGHGTPVNPGKLAAKEQAEFCGSCHRVKPPIGENELENIRFQPLRLMKSRCFTSGKLECTTCHVAHQDARRGDDAFYNAKCQTCHAAAIRADARGSVAGHGHGDARAAGDCVECHMPKAKLHPALTFTDHYIR